MTRFISFIATSVDGYIADAAGGVEWLERANLGVPAGEDFGYGKFMAEVDALIMGRLTFEQTRRFPQWPYGALPVIVFSRTMRALPEGAPRTVQRFDRTVDALAAMATARGYRAVYVDGGRTIQTFLVAGLLDQLTVTQIPVLLGGGAPLFGNLPAHMPLELVESRAYPFGFVQSTWRRRSQDASS